MSDYVLHRTLPNGNTAETTCKSIRQAASAACYVLADNLNVRRSDAEVVGFQLEHSPLGTHVPAYGYTFWISPVFQGPLEALRYHVTGAIERGESEAITALDDES